MKLTEEKLSGREVYRGRIIRVSVDEVRLPNGKASQREVVTHPGGVGILALDKDGRSYLVRQYRYAMGCVLREIPAGKREVGEEPLITAQRELSEELGATADRWQSLGEIVASPGCYDEVLYLYLAQDLHFSQQHPDEDEFLEVERIAFSDLVSQCLSGKIRDGKTVSAVLKAKILLNL